jgi:hypothetical protein
MRRCSFDTAGWKISVFEHDARRRIDVIFVRTHYGAAGGGGGGVILVVRLEAIR